jgi:glycolate oxidase iron-sulfur subunit
LGERLLRSALKEGLPSKMFGPAMKLGQSVRAILPEALKAKVPAKQAAGRWPTATHDRKVLMLAGWCASGNPAVGRVLWCGEIPPQ